MTILITGVAGFIGFHLARRLLQQSRAIVGLDNVNDYYDVTLKEAELAELTPFSGFEFIRADLANRIAIADVFQRQEIIEIVVDLAAQAGVRYSLVNPHAYIHSNIEGFLNILEACRHHRVRHLLYASSSSVYGAMTRMPFSVHQNVDHPISLYAATKKSNELMAHTYSHLFGLPTTGVRFFTVYGPWGRPDMAFFLFTRAILAGKPIQVFNNGNMQRELTYIDDVTEAVARLLDRVAVADPAWNSDCPDPATSAAAYRLYNLGNHQPVRACAFDRGSRGLPRPQSGRAVPAHAARRRSRHLCGYRRSCARRGFRAAHLYRGRSSGSIMSDGTGDFYRV